jgi:hypothetical protein
LQQSSTLAGTVANQPRALEDELQHQTYPASLPHEQGTSGNIAGSPHRLKKVQAEKRPNSTNEMVMNVVASKAIS